MSELKFIKLVFVFAAMCFIAKPFIGYQGIALLRRSNDSLILVKAFAKRKPEYMQEAEVKKASIQQLLSNPPASLMLAISALLSLLFPVIAFSKGITAQFINRLSLNSLQDEQTYLLTGKLSI